MESNTGRLRAGVGTVDDLLIGATMGMVHVTLAAVICIGWGGYDAFVIDTGCHHLLLSTGFIVAGVGALTQRHYASIPGGSAVWKLARVAAVIFTAWVALFFLPATPAIYEPVGVGPNLAYAALMTLAMLGVFVALHFALTDQSDLRRDLAAYR